MSSRGHGRAWSLQDKRTGWEEIHEMMTYGCAEEGQSKVYMMMGVCQH